MIIAALIFILIGILIKYGKMYFLISGYNTMSKEEKAGYNIKGIAGVIGNVMFGMALIIIVGYFMADWYEKPIIKMVALFGSIITGLTYLLIKTNSNEYKVDKTK